jgi:hypothetical protein
MSGTPETIFISVMPAEAGIQYHMTLRTLINWTPAFAGVTVFFAAFHQLTLTA